MAGFCLGSRAENRLAPHLHKVWPALHPAITKPAGRPRSLQLRQPRLPTEPAMSPEKISRTQRIARITLRLLKRSLRRQRHRRCTGEAT